jgi:hypothetical protein
MRSRRSDGRGRGRGGCYERLGGLGLRDRQWRTWLDGQRRDDDEASHPQDGRPVTVIREHEGVKRDVSTLGDALGRSLGWDGLSACKVEGRRQR